MKDQILICIISIQLNIQQEIVGITSNAPTLGFNDLEAVTQGSAQVKKENDPQFLDTKHQEAIDNSNIVDKLPKVRVNPVSGTNAPFYSATQVGEEHAGYPQYQDGTSNLVKQQNVCKLFVKQTCLRKDHCGWCGNGNTCVSGNLNTQDQKCSGEFIYTN